MENKIAVVTVIVEAPDAVERVNATLHDFRDYILGRQGLPVRDRNISVISIVMDAPQQEINSLSGKLGMIQGAKSKVLTTK